MPRRSWRSISGACRSWKASATCRAIGWGSAWAARSRCPRCIEILLLAVRPMLSLWRPGLEHQVPFADPQFGFGKLHLARDGDPPEVVGGLAVVVERQQLGAAGAPAAVELLRVEAEHVDAEAERARGV